MRARKVSAVLALFALALLGTFAGSAVGADGKPIQEIIAGWGLKAGTPDGTGTNAQFSRKVITLQGDPGVIQARIAGLCPAGSSIRSVDASGSVVCETDDTATYRAGGGITIIGDAIAVAPGGVSEQMLAFDPTTQSEFNSLTALLHSPGAINSFGNPVDWTQLKSVPPGLADGADDGITSVTGGAGITIAGSDSVPRVELAPREAWRVLGTAGAGAGLLSPFSNVGFAAPAFRKTQLGDVELKGSFGGPSNAIAFLLPPTFRPSETLMFPIPIGFPGGVASGGMLTLFPDGRVVPAGPAFSSYTFSVNGVRFTP